jgi:hypothetical protein
MSWHVGRSIGPLLLLDLLELGADTVAEALEGVADERDDVSAGLAGYASCRYKSVRVVL